MASSKSRAPSGTFFSKYRLEMMYGMICLALGMLSGYLSGAGDSLWYESLDKPSFNLPSWVFGPVWTVLYIMMGAALARLYRDRKQAGFLIILFWMQLTLNLVWSPLFFLFQRIDLSLIDICMLWLTLLYIMIGTRKHHIVFMLFLPYMLWVSFATVISYHIYQMNLIC